MYSVTEVYAILTGQPKTDYIITREISVANASEKRSDTNLDASRAARIKTMEILPESPFSMVHASQEGRRTKSAIYPS